MISNVTQNIFELNGYLNGLKDLIILSELSLEGTGPFSIKALAPHYLW